MSNVFDPSMYLDATLDKPLVKRDPASAGRDYSSLIKDLKARKWEKKDDPSQHGIAFDVVHEITLPQDEAARVGQEKITLNDGFIVDLTEAGMIDDAKGKNNRLRAYREALDMNKAGEAFSPRRMMGRTLVVQLKHELYMDTIQERIGAVRKQS